MCGGGTYQARPPTGLSGQYFSVTQGELYPKRNILIKHYITIYFISVRAFVPPFGLFVHLWWFECLPLCFGHLLPPFVLFISLI